MGNLPLVVQAFHDDAKDESAYYQLLLIVVEVVPELRSGVEQIAALNAGVFGDVILLEAVAVQPWKVDYQPHAGGYEENRHQDDEEYDGCFSCNFHGPS